jgi:hypothetical protein
MTTRPLVSLAAVLLVGLAAPARVEPHCALDACPGSSLQGSGIGRPERDEPR